VAGAALNVAAGSAAVDGEVVVRAAANVAAGERTAPRVRPVRPKVSVAARSKGDRRCARC